LYIELKGFKNKSNISTLLNRNVQKAKEVEKLYNKHIEVVYTDQFIDILKSEGL